MRIWINGLDGDDLSSVRGVGSYVSAAIEALKEYGEKYDIHLDKANPEIIIHPGFFPYAPLTLVKGVKNVLVIHDLIVLKHKKQFPAGFKGSLFWFFNKNKLSQFDYILTDTQVVAQEIMELTGIDRSKIGVVYPTAKKIFFDSPNYEGVSQKIPSSYVLYVGDVTWNKNLPNLARAIKQTEVALVLAGKALTDRSDLSHPWKKSFAEFINLVAEDKRFVFTGFVSDKELVNLYKKARAVVVPSYDEGFGLPWLEASILGTPVLAADIPVLREVSNGAAKWFDPNDVGALTDVIKEALTNRDVDLISRQEKQAQQYSHENFVAQLQQHLYTLTHV